MPPSFGVIYLFAPKLMLIIIANVQIHPHPQSRRHIEFPFCPWAKVINISAFLSAGTFAVASLLSLLLKNTSVPPPPSQSKHPPRVSKIQSQEPLFQQWCPSPRSQRYVFPPHLYLRLLLPFRFLQSHLTSAFTFRISGVI